MANTAVVEKKSVTKGQHQFNISVTCTVNDGVEDIFVRDFTKKHNPNNPIENVINAIRDEFMEQWTVFEEERAIFDSAAFTNAVSTMQTQANNFVN